MELKHNVKQRRSERLKRLQMQQSGGEQRAGGDERFGAAAPPRDGGAGRSPHATVSPPPGQVLDERWNDPEFVWKQRLQPGFGGGPTRGTDEPPRRLTPPTAKQLWLRLIVCGILFAAIWTMFRLPYPWAETGRRAVTTALTEPLNTAALTAWYEAKFHGTPSILPSFRRIGEESVKASSGGGRTYFAPAKGTIVQPYSSGKMGVLLATKQDAPVYAMDTGLVTFAGEKDGTGFTVMIRHPNGIQTVYGDVSECKLEVNDWIKGGEAIGKADPDGDGGKLYFAVQKDGRYVNPADVVAIVP
jgi:stage IV sporulation protein FA